MSSRAVIVTGRYRVPASALTLTGFRRWAHSPRFPRRGRVSFISGEVYFDMSPKEIRTHNSVKGDVFGTIWSQARIRNMGLSFADRALLIHGEAELATEPDVMFCAWESLESGRVTLVEHEPGSGRQTEVHGSPDLVVEIVNRSSVRKDKEKLRRSYYSAGVLEYWLIDARGEEIEFQVLRRGDDAFVPVEKDAQEFQQSTVLGRQVALTRELNRIGGWRYTLQIDQA